MKQLLSDVMSHLKQDRADFKKEAAEDGKLIKKIKGKAMSSHKKSKKMVEAGKKAGKALKKEVAAGKKEEKVAQVLREYKRGDLRSGSKKGPVVKKKSQALAIALNEGRKAARKKKK